MEELKREKKLGRSVLYGLIFFHLAALLAFYTGVSTTALIVCVVMYLIKGLGVTTGFHRYFTHKSFKTGRVFQFILGLMGSMASQGAILWWVSHHRDHHRDSDKENDIHSPVARGFWHAHMGWMYHPETFTKTATRANDISKFKELKLLQKYYPHIQIIQPILLFILGSYLAKTYPQLGTSGLQIAVWGTFVSTVTLWHSTFAVNSVCHTWGGQAYDAGDRSRNNPIIGILALGEGWHNNHHKFGNSARHGLEWWQFDLTYCLLRVLKAFRIVWALKLPKQHQLDDKINHNLKRMKV